MIREKQLFLRESGSVDGWKTTSLAKLNDCKGGSIWSVAAETVNGVVEYTKTINNNNPKQETDCNALTPQFVNIGK